MRGWVTRRETQYELAVPELPGISISVYKKKQKNSYIRVKEDGRVVVTAPLRVSRDYLSGFVSMHAEWIAAQRERAIARGAARRPEAPGEREALRALLREYIAYWEPKMGVRSAGFNIRDMKTRWGSCNVRTGKLTFNLQLIRFDRECAEYVVVHELAHLLERGHNPRFWGIVEKALPDYRERKKRLAGD